MENGGVEKPGIVAAVSVEIGVVAVIASGKGRERDRNVLEVYLRLVHAALLQKKGLTAGKE